MARRSAASFINSFSAAYGLTRRLRRDFELNDIADAKPETTTTREPTFAGMTGSLDEQDIPTRDRQQTKYLGQTFDGTATPEQMTSSRRAAQAGVLERFGDLEGADRMRRAAQEGQLLDARIAEAKRAEKAAADEEKFKAGLGELMKTSRAATAQAEGRPVGLTDTLADTATLMAYGAKHGRYDPQQWIWLAKTTDKIEDEGYHDALWAADSGASLDKVAARFNNAGAVKFDPATVISDTKGEATIRGVKVPTRLIQYKAGDGTVHTINTAAELAGLGDVKEILKTQFDLLHNEREAEGHRQDAAWRAEDKKRNAARMAAAVGIFRERNPEATPAELEAVRTGAMKPFAAGALTASQERSNAEIDAAREAVAGLTADEIRQRTSPTTATGRENPHFDPQLARQARLAERRKVGGDEEFDKRKNRSTPRARAAEALASDPAMQGYTLGNQTGRGFEVMDRGGKLIGYYGEQP